MNTRLILALLLTFSTLVLPAWAQDNCASLLTNALENTSGVEAVEHENNDYLVILDSNLRTENIKTVSRIKSLRNDRISAECDFSKSEIVILDSDLNSIKSGTEGSLKKSDIEKILYKYVYSLSPVDVEKNLNGYNRLHALSPSNNYYVARQKHYEKRLQLIKDRRQFIEKAEKEALRDKSIVDLVVKKDFYLAVTSTQHPLSTVEAFLNKVAELTPKPEKNICIVAYSADLKKRETKCPQEYRELLPGTEEELLMRHVQSLPGFLIEKNINGYAALKKINPSSTLYTKKLRAYKTKLHGLEKFMNLKTSSGKKIFNEFRREGHTLYATVSNEALNGKTESTALSLYRTLAEYYNYSGRPLKRCILKNQAGTTLGTIMCDRSGCSFR